MCCTPLMIKKDAEKYGACAYNRVPCGVCPECHQAKIDEWKFRFKYELRDSTSAYFITLTYNDESMLRTLHGHGTLFKRDLQLFFKRLRKAYSKVSSVKLRYLAVGEYGKRRGRPHYHICLLNMDYKYMYMVSRAWTTHCHVTGKYLTKGRVDIKGLYSVGAANYVMKYMNKSSPHLKKYDLRAKEFKVASINFGAGYLSPSVVAYHQASVENCYLTLPNGFKMSMPRWYKTKIYNADSPVKYYEVSEYLEQRAVEVQRVKLEKVMSRYSGMTYEDAILLVSNNKLRKEYPERLTEVV